MDCNCEKAPEFPTKAFIPGPIEIPINFRAVTIPADQGDDRTNPPLNGAYRNVVLKYEANGHTYIYSSDGVPVALLVEVGDVEFNEILDRPKYDGVPMDSNTNIPDLTDEIQTLNQEIQALATDFSYKGSVADYAHLPVNASVGDVYTTTDTGLIYVWDGTSWVALNSYPDVFTGADGSSAGTSGLVPAPAATDNKKYLAGDGTWKDTIAFLPLPSTVNTTGTTAQFISSIQALNAPAGTAYLGTVSLSDMPASLIQEEVEVFVYDNNTIYLIMRSADTAPYIWWCCSYQYAGWKPVGVNTVQTIGASTTDVMSQKAVTDTIFAGNNNGKVQIGGNATTTSSDYGVAIGWYSRATGTRGVAIGSATSSTGTMKAYAGGNESVAINGDATGNMAIAIGRGSSASGAGAVALGAYSAAGAGIVSIGSSQTSYGYNSSNYRLLRGVHDPQAANDAATKGYVDGLIAQNPGTPTTSTVGTVGQILQDTVNGKLYICTDTTGGVYTWVEVGTGAGVSITMTSTDPGEGAPLAANEFIAVYNAS